MKPRSPSFHRLFPVIALVAAFSHGLGCGDDEEPEPDDDADCGNGAVESGEGCDDGDANSDETPDACRESCQPASCGDGVKDSAEDCDDGNTAAGDGCDAQCSVEFTCGNSVCEVLKGETCEQCAADCCTCGDGLCEVLNGESCSNCAQDCCSCGDGVCDLLQGETCGGCKSDCCPGCGNGFLDTGETCDDGNNVSGDGCSAECKDEDGQAECGNGVLEAGETCDDGNTTPGDGCSQVCGTEFTCGDFTCDTANNETCALCPGDCCPNCGNGFLDAGEECDGNLTGGVTCTTACYDGGTIGCTPGCEISYAGCMGSLPTCGDGVAECNEPCDGADLNGATCLGLGYADGTLACDATCGFNTSGCGPMLGYLNQNFDVQCPPAGWTFGGDWECGVPTSGPLAPYSTPNCIATNLQGNYSPNQSGSVATVTTPSIDLSAATDPYLSLRAWWQTESGYDGWNIKISTDGGATYAVLADVLPPYNTSNGVEPTWEGDQSGSGWQEVTASLAAYVGQTVRLQLSFYSDSSAEYPGVYVDDVRVLDTAMMPLSITTPSLPSAGTDQPYQVQLTKSGGTAASLWSIQSGTNHGWLSVEPTTGLLSGTPTAANIGPVTVTVRVEEPSFPSNYADQTFTFDVAQSVVAYQTSFEGACPDGWTLTGDWECGAPTGSGPGAAHGGTQCLATQIDGPYSNYQTWATTTATSPTIALPAGTATLTFWMWAQTEGSIYDGANLKISANGGAFQLVSGVSPAYNLANVGGEPAWGDTASFSGWQQVTADLSAYAGQSVQLRFAFQSDGSGVYPGVYIDEITVQ